MDLRAANKHAIVALATNAYIYTCTCGYEIGTSLANKFSDYSAWPRVSSDSSLINAGCKERCWSAACGCKAVMAIIGSWQKARVSFECIYNEHDEHWLIWSIQN